MTRPYQFPLAAALLFLWWGCAAEAPRSEGTMPRELARAVAATDSMLAAGASADSLTLDHLRILELRSRLRDPDDATAISEFLDRWEASPGDLRLLDTALYRRETLDALPRWEALYSAAVGSDTTSCAWLFVTARGTGRARRTDLDPYRRLEAENDLLQPGEQVFLQRILANAESQAWLARDALQRRLEGMAALLRVGGPSRAAYSWYQIAMHYLEADELAFARIAAMRLARCVESVPAPVLRLRRVYADACILAREARYEAALDSLRAMEARAETWGSWSRQSLAIDRQVLVERARGRLASAASHLRRSSRLAADRGEWGRVTEYRCVLAELSREMGDLDGARRHIAAADSLQTLLGREDLRKHVDLERLRFALQIGEFAVADSLTSDLLARPSVREDVELVRDLKLDLMTFGLENDRPDLAYRSLEHLRSRRVATHRSADYDARLWVALRAAELHARQGEFVVAAAELDTLESLITSAISAPDLWLLEWTRGRVAEAMADPVQGERAYRQALDTALSLGDPDKVRRSRVGLGRILLETARWEEARQLFAAGLGAPEFWTAFVSALSTGQALAGEGRHAEALTAYDEAAALLGPDVTRSLTTRLELARARSEVGIGRPEAAWRRLQGAGGTDDQHLEKELADVLRAFHRADERDRAELMLGLLVDHPKLAGPEGNGRAALRIEASVRRVAGDTLSAELPDSVARGDLTLRFFLGRERAFAWTGTCDGWSLRELEGSQRLVQRCRDIVADVAQPHGEVDVDAARELGRELLGPDAGSWGMDGTLEIAADGVLHELPWPALPWPDGGGQLVDRGPIRHIAATRHAAAASRTSLRLLVVGVDDAGEAAAGSSVLRAAEQEARDVAALFPAAGKVALLGADADWEEVLDLPLESFDVLHVATHASVSHGRRGHSVLRFLGGRGERPVTANEIRELPLTADLVYLSCCEGARTAVDQGSGVDSLARSFLQAGAHAVVASTQVMEDEASRLLARRFYAEWLSGRSAAASLRAAQRALRDGDPHRRHPYYWASLRVLDADW